MTASVDVYERVEAVPDWDDFVTACGAPVFYHATFLSAYRKAELQPAEAHAYLTLRDADRAPRAALPVTLHGDIDPLGVLTPYEPGIARQPRGLLSHVWHCYDTWLPTRPGDSEALLTVLDGFRALATELSVPWYGLVNVDATGPLARALAETGARGVPIDERYVLDLPPGTTLEGFLAGLGRDHRYTLRSHQRRAAKAGVAVRILDPAQADLDEHLRLVRLIGAKHGVEHFYPDGAFQEFQLGLGDAARIIEVRLGDRLLGVGVCLLDAHRLHFWTCGVDYGAAPGFSPFYVLYYEALRHAIDLGVPVFECGRRNGVFKSRYGMRPVPLLAYLAPTSRSLVSGR